MVRLSLGQISLLFPGLPGAAKGFIILVPFLSVQRTEGSAILNMTVIPNEALRQAQDKLRGVRQSSRQQETAKMPFGYTEEHRLAVTN